MRILTRLTAGLTLCLPLVACGPSTAPSGTDRAADIAAINEVNERMLGALNSGDWARLNELTASDYVAIIGGTPIQGKTQLDQANRRFLEQWIDVEKWNPDETIVDGDLAFQRGAFTMTLTPRQGGGETRNLAGTYLHVYQRRADGAWALTRAMAATAGE